MTKKPNVIGLSRTIMSTALKQQIAKLQAEEVRKVCSALLNRLRQRLAEQFKHDKAMISELRRIDPDQAAAILGSDFPEIGELATYPTDDQLRALLGELSEIPEYEAHVRVALDHRLVAFAPGLEVVASSALVVFLLSVDFKVDLERKNGKWEFHFKASKKPTPALLMRAILGLSPPKGAPQQ
jgi:hypothetical protein